MGDPMQSGTWNFDPSTHATINAITAEVSGSALGALCVYGNLEDGESFFSMPVILFAIWSLSAVVLMSCTGTNQIPPIVRSISIVTSAIVTGLFVVVPLVMTGVHWHKIRNGTANTPQNKVSYSMYPTAEAIGKME